MYTSALRTRQAKPDLLLLLFLLLELLLLLLPLLQVEGSRSACSGGGVAQGG